MERSPESAERTTPRERSGPPRSPARIRWRPLLLTLTVVGLALGADWARPPQRQLTTRAALAAIDLYQATLSRGMGRLGVHCRFTPSCSRYGEAVIARDGVAIGGLRALWRIARCGPWTPDGTIDPPEEAPSRVAGGQPELEASSSGDASAGVPDQ